MSEKLTLYVVPHTHWDREWYGSYQLFRVRLVRLLNKLLALLERDPDYQSFNLDGQTVILEDFLEVHPEKRDAIAQLVRERRLLIGPWYILPDSFLCGGESFVRNLLLGGQIARDFGHRMNVGYIPDTFGHIGQLPQLLRGFGLENCMHFRGMDIADKASELWWEAPDGSRVLLHHLSPIIGYSDAAVLHHDPASAAQDLRALAHYKAERATTNVVLALQGVDHVEAREDLSAILAFGRKTIDDVEFKHASLEQFWAALTEAVDGDSLETVVGELRDVPRTDQSMNFLLYNVLSSRADNKLDNAKTLNMLEQWAEPWAAQAWAWGVADYPRGHLWTAWRWLLKNHPHDSIGGCSVDEVHRQMATRFEWAREIGDYLTEERQRLIVEQIDFEGLAENELGVVLFNASPWERDEVVSVEIDIPLYWLKQQAAANHQPPAPLTDEATYLERLGPRTRAEWLYGMPELPTPDFRGLWIRPIGQADPIPLEITNMEETPVSLALASGPRGTVEVRRVTAHFNAQLPPLGYASYALSTDPNPVKWPAPAQQTGVIENQFLRVAVQPNGTFDLHDLTNDHMWRGLGLFEDGGDNGDGYMYSPPPFDQLVSTLGSNARISHVGRGVGRQQIRIEHTLLLPVGVNDARDRRREETVACPLALDLILRDGVPRLEMAVTFDNRARDHRLRMLFPTDLDADVAHSSMQFDVMSRPIAPEPIAPGDWWVEDPPSTFPMHGWMDIHDGQHGLGVLAEGVYEFGVNRSPRREVALTLLRAVGYLGARFDLTTIIRGAGPSMPTPEAQLQRSLTWRLALVPHAGSWESAELWKQSAEFGSPPRVITSPKHDGSRSATAAGLTIDSSRAVVSAIKQSEDGQSLLVRLYNPTATVTTAKLSGLTIVAAESAELDESPLEKIDLNKDGGVPISLPPKKIVSVRLTLERP